ncbi:MAG: ATP-binding protein, partial [Myxococcota bacterium]|nr:ATP-binding protein [Myxococcota bacterium]
MTKTLKMKVDNTGFLLDRMGKDCAPLQYLRELTQNALEAIARAGRTEGMILWEADQTRSSSGVLKLSITDNGIGMSGEEMIRYINTLSSSGSRQALDGNYGVGAKITAATRNPAGLVYLSWKEGRSGEAIQMVRDPSGQYGLLSFSNDGDSDFVAAVDDEERPEVIKTAGSGTRIVLMG